MKTSFPILAIAILSLGLGAASCGSSDDSPGGQAALGGAGAASATGGGGAGGALGGAGGLSGSGGAAGATAGSGGIGGAAAGAGGAGGVGGAGGAGAAAGVGGVGGTGGATSLCGGHACGKLEQCHKGEICVAMAVAVTGGYSIDATEVTRSQYAAWLATNPSLTVQPSQCDGNKDFVPVATCMAGSHVCKANCDSHPQPCVDWCDAYAYCKAVGKRLCGKIGGGSNPPDAASDQWIHACTSGGANAYPYGNAYQSAVCNDGSDTVAVGSRAGCVSSASGYQGIYDLSGNVWEWSDSCAGSTADDPCITRGGSYSASDSHLRCDGDYGRSRTYENSTLGFRCCSEP